MSQFRVRFKAKPEPAPTAQQQWELTRELSNAGVQIMCENLRRRDPEATEAQIEARLERWLEHRPGALAGDGPQPREGGCRNRSL